MTLKANGGVSLSIFELAFLLADEADILLSMETSRRNRRCQPFNEDYNPHYEVGIADETMTTTIHHSYPGTTYCQNPT